jgi:SAM-dependent methyltransferase
VYLNSGGFDVTGIDLSPKNIAYARQYENDRLHFYVHDMREPFRDNVFCHVLNLFTSFGYFRTEGENVNVICSATRALRKGGKLVIDFMNTDKIIKGLQPYQVKEVGGIRFQISKTVQARFIVKDIHFADQGGTYHFQERVKAITYGDFLSYFDMADLEVLHTFGDYHLNPYHPDTSDRMIFVTRKPEEDTFGKL